MKECKYILFDLDGTVTNPKTGITRAVAYALRYFGIIVDDLDVLTTFIGPPLKDSFMNDYGFCEQDADRAIAKYREYFGTVGLYENAVYPGMEHLLQTLVDRNRTLMIATSKPTVYAVKILEHFGLIPYFQFISGSELDGTRTKKGEVIAYALAQNGITALSDVVMVGDREHDMIGAKENGLAAIGVLYGYGSLAELQSSGADAIAEEIDDLHRLLIGGRP